MAWWFSFFIYIMITYRKAIESDTKDIVALFINDPVRKPMENINNLQSYISAFNRINNSVDNFLMVMLKDNIIIGTFQLTIIPCLLAQGESRAIVESVFIDHQLHGNGYGSQMMKYAIQMAKEKGAKIVQLTTNKKRIDAKHFYEKLGFVASHEGMKLDVS